MGNWRRLALSVCFTVVVPKAFCVAGAAQSQPNVLLIAIDDLRPELNCYGAKSIHSPNIDALASSGRRFGSAYCQQAVCNPSRTSLMTGMRPDSIGVVGNHTHFRDKHPDVVTLPQHFKNNGYHAAAIGKIFHGVFPDGASITKWDTMGDPDSWSVPAIRFGPRYYYTEKGIAAAKQTYQKVYKPTDPGPDDWTKKLVFGPATEAPNVDDGRLYDGQVADAAVQMLQEMESANKPFFLAVGFIKPHSPYIAPKKYFDLYPEVDLASKTWFPIDAPAFAGHGSGELRRYTDQPARGVIPDRNQVRLRQAYFACISYVDAQVGRVLDQLDRSGLRDNTIVVLFGDHGYHLGEQGLWGKTTNFELDTRVPLIVRAPGMNAIGEASKQLVELVDLYPTLSELAGLPIVEGLAGASFTRVLRDPESVTKPAVLSQYPRGKRMGYSMRTATHRLTQWFDRETGQVEATELYESRVGQVEERNIARLKPDVVKQLSDQLRAMIDIPTLVAKQPNGGPRVTSNSEAVSNFYNSDDLPASPFSSENEEALLDESATDQVAKPNVLFIISEDNSDHLGCYGETRVHTPNLDALAAGGVRYTRAYVPYSVCSPSRAAFLTGLYTRQTGHVGLATHRFSMYRDFKTLPAYFKNSGYYTGFLGKTHINPERLVEDFIDHRAITHANFSKTTSIEKYAEQAGLVMQQAAASKRPFMLIINYADAHRKFVGKSKHGFPTIPVDQEIAPFPWIGSDSPHLRDELRDYFNCINRLDEGIGMVLGKLDQTDARDNTIIVYIADHGADFPRGKGSIYENGTRIPMIVHYPKEFKQGKVERGMVSTIDIVPTLLQAANLRVPDHLPGIPLQKIDSGEVSARSHIHTFTTGSSPNLLYLQFGIRDDRYKLVYNPDRSINRLAQSRYRNSQLPEEEHVAGFLHPPEYELFDLETDPYEWTNLAASPGHLAIKERLLDEMRAFQVRIKDPLVDDANLRKFIKEQREYQNKPYKTPGFRWPHLEMFKQAQEAK